MKVGIINFKMGNINSVKNALEYLGCQTVIINNRDHLKDEISHIILPGVGSFKDAMNNLRSMLIIEKLREEVLIKKKKILGICLGMQLLGSSSTEDGFTNGLSFVENKVTRFNIEDIGNLQIPHIGFNNIKVIKSNNKFFSNVDEKSNFYFVHSYKMDVENFSQNFATCNYGIDFLAAFQKDNIYGTQFHPEKSQSCGIELIFNFLNNK